MTHEQIKKALLKRGLTFTALAKASGKKYQTLSACSARKAVSKPAALIIAAGLGMDITEVFPDVKKYSEPSRGQKSKDSVEIAKKALSDASIRVA